MDSALLKEREDFKRRAMAVPVVENKKRKVEDTKKSSTSGGSGGGGGGGGSSKSRGPAFPSKFSAGGSQFKFGVLGKLSVVNLLFFLFLRKLNKK